MSLDFWDLVLVLVVSSQATVLAYIYAPKWEAIILSLPFPFTVAALAVGRPVDATNVLGLALLVFFTHGVRILHYDFHLSIISSIILAASGYCVMGTLMAGVLPSNDFVFWTSCLLVVGIAMWLLVISTHSEENGHRTPLPVWVKLPVIVAVVVSLILIKQRLHGFMTVFPMVGVIAAYEARTCLWTISRQIPVIILTLLPMIMICRIAQEWIGLGFSLLLGWPVFLIGLIILTRFMEHMDKPVGDDTTFLHTS